MRKIDIEFVAGFAVGRFAANIEYPLKLTPELEELIEKAVEDALKYLDTPKEFEADVMKEIEAMTSDD